MKYILCSVIVLCLASLLVGQVAQAAGSKIAVDATAPEAMCPAAAPLDALIAGTFPAMPPAENGFSSGAGPEGDAPVGYRYESQSQFACFAAAGPGSNRQSMHHDQWWLATTRLLPSYPPLQGFIFLPFGWYWIDSAR